MRSAVLVTSGLAGCAQPTATPASEAAAATSSPTGSQTSVSSVATASTPAAPPSASAAPTSTPPASSSANGLPAGSGDYSAVLDLATRYKKGALSFDALKSALLAKNLRKHALGDGYLMTPSPVPPPGVKSVRGMMPKDWEGTWGEVAMAYWLDQLTRAEYDKLHAAAHPSCPK